MQLMGTALLIAMIGGMWIGTASALKRDGWFDTAATLTVMILVSIPTFWLGLVAIYIFAIQLQILPAGGRSTLGDGSILDHLRHLVAPAVVLAAVNTAPWARYMRAAVLDVADQDHVRTAIGKGLRPGRILRRHIVRNALLPMITLAGLQLPLVFSGALVAETVFSWPGMGRLFLDSNGYSDYPVVMGILILTAVLVLLGNLLADALYFVVDPRIRP